jgi:hypothetical protein
LSNVRAFLFLCGFTWLPLGFAQNTIEHVGDSFFTKSAASQNSAKDVQKRPNKTAQKKTNETEPKTQDQAAEQSQYGGSFFADAPKHQLESITITQTGIAIEQHQTFSNFFAFFNQLLKSRIFYEGRVVGLVNYITQPPPAPPLVSHPIPVSSEYNTAGYGGVGILGYNIELNQNVSLLPFVRGQLLRNATGSYSDSHGNKISSVVYAFLPGLKLSMRVNDVFAIATSAYGGYQHSALSGKGAYATKGRPDLNIYAGTLEFAGPYKLTRRLTFIPYLQMNTSAFNPNHTARVSPYFVTQFTVTNYVFAFRLSYELGT